MWGLWERSGDQPPHHQPIACTYAAVERVNHDSLWPTLEELVQLPFFRYFKVWLFSQTHLFAHISVFLHIPTNHTTRSICIVGVPYGLMMDNAL